MTIGTDGKWTYLVDNEQSAVQELDVGDTITETFTVQTADGTNVDITVTINGAEDIPVISDYVIGAVTEDDDLSTLEYVGNLTIVDNDAGESIFDTTRVDTLTNSDGISSLGSVTITADGQWTYTIDNTLPQVQELGVGDSFTERFEVFSVDGLASQIIEVTVNGVNDGATITGNSESFAVEDLYTIVGDKLEAYGELDVDDPDIGESLFSTTVNDVTDPTYGAPVGSVSILPDGTWTYQVDKDNATIQSLAKGEEREERFTVTSADGTATEEIVVTIVGTNDDPTINANSVKTGTVTEDEASVPPGLPTATGDLNVLDVDTIDTHTWSLISSPTGQYGSLTLDTATGTWTYTLSNDAANPLQAGQQVIEYFSVKVDDGNGGVATDQIAVTVIGSNDDPTISGDSSGLVIEDGGTLATVKGNLVVDDDDTLDVHTWSVTDGAGLYGDLTIDANTGEWTYVLDPDKSDFMEEGVIYDEDPLTVTVSDGKGGSDTYTINVQVEGNNDGPMITRSNSNPIGRITVREDQVDNDGSGRTVLRRVISNDPDENEDHTWEVIDANGDSLAIENGVAVGEYGNLSIEIDTNGRVFLRYDLQVTDEQDANAQVLRRNQNVEETFTIKVTDKYGATDEEVYRVRVRGDNDQPDIQGIFSGEVTEDDFNGEPTITASGVLDPGDIDTLDTHRWSIDTNTGDYGTIALVTDPDTGEATWTYTLNNDNPAVQALREGDDPLTETFTVTVRDNSGRSNSTDTQEITVLINGSNDQPLLTGNLSGSVIEPAHKDADPVVTATGELAVSDRDTTDTHTFSVVSDKADVDLDDPTIGKYGELTVDANGVWTYELDNTLNATKAIPPGVTMLDEFTVTVTDAGGLTSEVTVVVAVAGSNTDPDIMTADSYQVFEDGAALTGNLVKGTAGTMSGNDIGSGDPDSGDDATWTVVQNGTYGTFEFVTDADGNQVSWKYTLFTEADVNADPSKAGAYNLVNALAEGETLPSGDSVVIRVTDEFGMTTTETINIDILGANDNPVISGFNNNIREDVFEANNYETSGQLGDGDVDTSNTHAWQLVDNNGGMGQYGTFAMAEDGSWTYTLNSDYIDDVQALHPDSSHRLTDTFEVRVVDNDGGFDTETVTINITPSNDAPVITGGLSGEFVEDSGLAKVEGQIVITDIDQGDLNATGDEDQPSFVAQNYTGTFGSLVLNADGSWEYTPDNDLIQSLAEGEQKQDKFIILAQDENGATITEELVMTITGDNDKPTISGDNFGLVVEDGGAGVFGQDLTRAEGRLFAADIDNNSPDRNWSIVGDGDGEYGVLTLNNDGEWLYVLNNDDPKLDDLDFGEEFTETFKVVVTDNVTDVETNTPGVSQEFTINVKVVGQNEFNGEPGGPGGGNPIILDADVTEDFKQSHSESIDNAIRPDSIRPLSGGVFGELVVDPSDPSGETWVYNLFNGNDLVQMLEEGETVTEVWRFRDDTGQAHVVNVTITGSADKPEIYVGDTEVMDGDVIGEVTEGAVTSSSGRLSAVDPDINEEVQWTISNGVTGTGGVTATGVYGTLTIDEDTGEWVYELHPGANLPAGEVFEEVFTVKATDTDAIAGTEDINATTSFDVHNVAIKVVGTAQNVDNPTLGDVPLIIQTVSTNEDNGVANTEPTTVETTGTLSFDNLTDQDGNPISVDLDDEVKWTLVDGSSPYGDITVNPTTGAWTFTLDNDSGAVQGLREGQTVEETFEVYAIDQYGKTIVDDSGIPQTLQIVVDITGQNDGPVASSFVEDIIAETDAQNGVKTMTGQLTVDDVDVGDEHVWSTSPQLVGGGPEYGTLTVNDDGSWEFNVNTLQDAIVELNQGETLTQEYEIVVTDMDGAGLNATQTITINIVGTNQEPEITTSTLAEDNSISEPAEGEDQTPTITGEITLTDVDNPGAEDDVVTLHESTLNGTYGEFEVVAGTGGQPDEWRYTLYDAPHVNALAEGVKVTESFIVRATDEYGAEVMTTVEIEVVGTNDKPTIEGKVIGTVVDEPSATATGQLVVADPDIGDTHTFAASYDTDIGTFEIDDATGNWTFTINSNSEIVNNLPKGETMQTTISVSAVDSAGQPNSTSDAKDIVITIVGTNDAPAIKDVAEQQLVENDVTTLSGQFDSGDLDNNADAADGSRTESSASNDPDDATDSDAQTWQVIDSDPRGTLTVNSSTGEWTFNLVDQFEELSSGETLDTPLQYTVKVTDEFGLSSEKVIEFQVTGTDDLPSIVVADTVATGTVYEDPEGAESDVATGVVHIEDIDESDTHDYSLSEDTLGVTSIQGQYGVLHLVNVDGTSDSVEWRYELDQALANSLNEGPVTEQFELHIASVANGITQPDKISQVIEVTVEGSNDAAIIDAGSDDITETDAVISTSGQISAEDVDNPDDTFTPQTNVAGTYGTFSIAADGSWTYTTTTPMNELAEGQVVTEVFDVTSVDLTPSTVTVNITGTNDAPVIDAQNSVVGGTAYESGTEGSGFVAGNVMFTDVDTTDTHRVSLSEIGTTTEVDGNYGTLKLVAGSSATDVRWEYTIDPAKVAGLGDQVIQEDTFNVYVESTQGGILQADTISQPITIMIDGFNNTPVVTTPDGQDEGAVVEDGSPLQATGTLTSTDAESETITYSFDEAQQSQYGTFEITDTGNWTYTLDTNSSQALNTGDITETFTVTLTDTDGNSTTEDVMITLTGENDAPVITSSSSDQMGDVEEDNGSASFATGSLSATDSESQTVTYSHTGGTAQYGTFGISSSGMWTYTLDPTLSQSIDDSGAVESFVITLTDGTNSLTETVNINIQGNDDDVVIAGTFVGDVQEGTMEEATGTVTASDVDGPTPTMRLQSPDVNNVNSATGTYGRLSFNAATGLWAYVLLTDQALPALGETETDTFVVEILQDSGSGPVVTETQTITVTVAGNNVISGESNMSDLLAATTDDEWLFGNDYDATGTTSDDTAVSDKFAWDTAALSGTDSIKDFDAKFVGATPAANPDVVDLTGVQFSDQMRVDEQIGIEDNGMDTVITINDENGAVQTIIVEGVLLTDMLGNDADIDNMSNAELLVALNQTGQLLLPSGLIEQGDSGDNTLIGDGGSNILFGGGGDDILTGGDGNDLFLFTEDAAGTTSDPAEQTVTDFSVGSDILDISDLLPAHGNIEDLLSNISVSVTDDPDDASDNATTVISVTKDGEQTDITLEGVGWNELGIDNDSIIESPGDYQLELIMQLDTMNVIKVDP